MTGLVPDKTGSIHPLVWSKASREDDDFVKNHVSAHFRISPKTAIVIMTVIVLFFILLIAIS